MFDLEMPETETAVAVVITALLVSPRARRMLRRGIVLGLAGVLTAADTAQGIFRGIRGGSHASQPTSTSEASANS